MGTGLGQHLCGFLVAQTQMCLCVLCCPAHLLLYACPVWETVCSMPAPQRQTKAVVDGLVCSVCWLPPPRPLTLGAGCLQRSAQIACQPGVQGLALFSPVQGTVLASPMLTVRAARKAARAARAQPKGVAGTAVPSAARGQCAGVSGSVRGCGGSNGLMAGTFSAFACLQAAIVR